MRITMVLWLALWAPSAQTLKKRTRVKLVPRILEQVQGCQNTLVTYNYTVHTDPQRLYLVDFDAIIHASAKYWTQLYLKMDRCRGGISSNTCEYYGKWTWSVAVCNLIMTRGMTWTPSIDGIAPKVQCPFKAGRYQLRNMTFDMDKAAMVMGRDIMGSVWLVEMRLVDERGNTHICTTFNGEVVRVRVPVDEGA